MAAFGLTLEQLLRRKMGLPNPVTPDMLSNDRNGITGQPLSEEPDGGGGAATSQLGVPRSTSVAPVDTSSAPRPQIQSGPPQEQLPPQVTIPPSAFPSPGPPGQAAPIPQGAFPQGPPPAPPQGAPQGQGLPPQNPLIQQAAQNVIRPEPALPKPNAWRRLAGGLIASPFGMGLQGLAPLAEYGPKGLDQIRQHQQWESGLPNQVHIADTLINDETRREGTAQRNQQPHATLQTDQGIKQWNPATSRFDIDAGQPPVKEEDEGKTVITDQGVLQWNPKSKAYDIKVGNAPEKESPDKTLQDADGAWYHIGKDNAAVPITINGKPFQGKSPAEKTDNDFEQFYKQFISDNKLPDNSANRKKAKTEWTAASQAPDRADRGQNFIDPTTNKLTRVEPGGTVPQGALTPAGLNATNTPTAQTKTMAETAPKVIELANRSSQLIDQQIKSLGPAASRWSEFMAGKVGAPNPEFTKLRTNIGLLQTALMRMHVGARGGEQMMQHFQNLIDVAKQDPANLKAAIGEIVAYANEVKAQPGGGTGTPGAGTSTIDDLVKKYGGK